MRKKLTLALALCLSTLSFTGCGEEEQQPTVKEYLAGNTYEVVSSKYIVEWWNDQDVQDFEYQNFNPYIGSRISFDPNVNIHTQTVRVSNYILPHGMEFLPHSEWSFPPLVEGVMNYTRYVENPQPNVKAVFGHVWNNGNTYSTRQEILTINATEMTMKIPYLHYLNGTNDMLGYIELHLIKR